MEEIRSKYDDYVIDSNEAIEFKLVRDREDLENDDVSFKPEMSHQIFGNNETIYGYKDLKVKLYFSATNLAVYLGLKYTDIIVPKKGDQVEPDNIVELIKPKLPPGVLSSVEEFIKVLDTEAKFVPYGELLSSFSIAGEDNSSRTFEIYYCDTTNKKFLNFHERLQFFILFYIDAASYIDVDDDKWRFFVVYEKYKNKNQDTCYAVAGYTTTYIYYAYPANVRPRISQMLILPPFQKQGLGAHLLHAIYNYYITQKDVLDITVEGPNDEFQCLRDYVDVCLCANLECFSIDKLKKGFSPEMIQQTQQTYKINKKQARRVYEILRLKSTNTADTRELQEFRLDVKKRLNIPFQKEKNYLKKMKPLMDNPQYQMTLSLNSAEQRLETLDKLFNSTMEEYQKVLQRVSNKPLIN